MTQRTGSRPRPRIARQMPLNLILNTLHTELIWIQEDDQWKYAHFTLILLSAHYSKKKNGAATLHLFKITTHHHVCKVVYLFVMLLKVHCRLSSTKKQNKKWILAVRFIMFLRPGNSQYNSQPCHITGNIAWVPALSNKPETKQLTVQTRKVCVERGWEAILDLYLWWKVMAPI